MCWRKDVLECMCICCISAAWLQTVMMVAEHMKQREYTLQHWTRGKAKTVASTTTNDNATRVQRSS